MKMMVNKYDDDDGDGGRLSFVKNNYWRSPMNESLAVCVPVVDGGVKDAL